jgi:hypothetical protein
MTTAIGTRKQIDSISAQSRISRYITRFMATIYSAQHSRRRQRQTNPRTEAEAHATATLPMIESGIRERRGITRESSGAQPIERP